LSDALSGGITSEHTYVLPLGRQAVWDLISDMGAYRGWWTWLRTFEAGGLRAGEEWRCTVQPPLPYLVRFVVHIEEVEAPHVVRARVSGDVVGTATLEIEEEEDACIATLSSTLAPGNSILRLVSRMAAPLARFGHDWVLDSGARQFIARAVTPTLTD
jgi:uncharacterized protein YndB with AHSA1/START domain